MKLRVQAIERLKPEKQENRDKMEVEYTMDPRSLLPHGLRYHPLYSQRLTTAIKAKMSKVNNTLISRPREWVRIWSVLLLIS